MQAIVAVDLNWGIGCGGKLLQTIPEDMKFFKEKTIGKIVIMGRETFESLPEKSPLKDRINIILSKDDSFNDDRIIICRSLDEVFNNIKKYDTDDIYVIGGESVYNQFLPYCKAAYVTKIKNGYTADKHFPNLDEKKAWDLEFISDLKEFNNIQYSFLKYINNQLEQYGVSGGKQ